MALFIPHLRSHRGVVLASGSVTPGATGIQGAVSLSGSPTTPVGGGFVEVFDAAGTVWLTTLNVAGDGTFAVAGLSPATYTLKYHAPPTHSLGPSEPNTRSVVVSSGGMTTQNFVAQPTIYYDNFQSYSTAQLTGTGAGAFFNGGGKDKTVNQSGGTVTMDPTGGPFGGKAVHYHWDADPWDGVEAKGSSSTGYCGAQSKNVNIQPRFASGLGQTATNIYFRFTEKYSANMSIGSPDCAGIAGFSLKTFLIVFENPSRIGRFGLYLASGTNGIANGITMDMNDFGGGHAYLPSGTSISTDVWTTWVVAITGMGTTACAMSLYRDGVLRQTLDHDPNSPNDTCQFWPGQPIDSTFALTMEMGANMNHGPQTAGDRWISEIGTYWTRPSLLPQSAT